MHNLHIETISTLCKGYLRKSQQHLVIAAIFLHSRAMQNPVGRPREYSDADIQSAWNRHAAGEKLVDICGVDNAPSFGVLIERTALSPELSKIAAAAREEFAHRMVYASIDIADKDVDSQRARNRIAARQWFASKYARQTFGDKVELNVTGTVSVSAALEEARNRVRPISDLSQTPNPQVIDLTAESVLAPSDNESLGADIDPLS
jgi:hypothetical protein